MDGITGIPADNSSLMSSTSGTERDDTDEEILSFDLGPEPFDPMGQGRLSSDEWLDDFQQGLPNPETWITNTSRCLRNHLSST